MHIVPFTLKNVFTFSPAEHLRATVDPGWLFYETHIARESPISSPVPELGAAVLLLLGLLGIAARRRRGR